MASRLPYSRAWGWWEVVLTVATPVFLGGRRCVVFPPRGELGGVPIDGGGSGSFPPAGIGRGDSTSQPHPGFGRPAWSLASVAGPQLPRGGPFGGPSPLAAKGPRWWFMGVPYPSSKRRAVAPLFVDQRFALWASGDAFLAGQVVKDPPPPRPRGPG